MAKPDKAAISFPKEGLFLASGVYSQRGQLAWRGGNFHTEWSPVLPLSADIPALARKEHQGNTIQSWSHGDDAVEWARITGKEGLYMMFCCGGGDSEVCRKVMEYAKFAAYDLHEMYTFDLYDANAAAEETSGKTGAPADKQPGAYTLGMTIDKYLANVRAGVDRLHSNGWFPLTCSAANTQMDYKMLGGVDIPGIEFYAYADTLFACGFLRGLARQHRTGAWHAYLAHDWYSFTPHTNPHKMDSLLLMLRLQYMNGVKILTLESGNWWAQSNLCSDSPQMYLPQIKLTDAMLGRWLDNEEAANAVTEDELREAKRKFSWIDYRSPVASKYRKAMRDFWDFVSENPQSDAQPEVTVAFAKGNHDFANGSLENFPVAGAYSIAKADRHWMNGAPEKSWDIIKDLFFPKPPILGNDKNLFYSGTPYGITDTVSFAENRITADFLLRNYKALIFSGWNTCSKEQYEILCEYVRGGGRLCIGIPHLSTNDSRNYDFYSREELVNGGDFSELCGIKVTAQGDYFWWATGPSFEKNCLGLRSRRRYGHMGTRLGTVEYTGPAENYEVLACDDEAARPVIIRAKKGKGEVFFLNIWEYPSVANRDLGAGATNDSKGLIGELYSYIARISRGNVWITGPDFEKPDEDCNWIVYTYHPSSGRIFFLNLDFDNERKCVLHWFGEKDFITLLPGEFRIIEAPVLEEAERLNDI